MSSSRISGRYAKALIELAEEKGALTEVSSDIKSLLSIIQSNNDLQSFFQSPVIKPAKKTTTASAMFEGKVHNITWLFLSLLIRKRREGHIEDVFAAYNQQYNKLNKIATATLITATEVGDEIKDKVKGMVLKSLEGVETVEITTEIDKSLLGGFVLKYEDKLYDASLKKKLERLRKEFS